MKLTTELQQDITSGYCIDRLDIDALQLATNLNKQQILTFIENTTQSLIQNSFPTAITLYITLISMSWHVTVWKGHAKSLLNSIMGNVGSIIYRIVGVNNTAASNWCWSLHCARSRRVNKEERATKANNLLSTDNNNSNISTLQAEGRREQRAPTAAKAHVQQYSPHFKFTINDPHLPRFLTAPPPPSPAHGPHRLQRADCFGTFCVILLSNTPTHGEYIINCLAEVTRLTKSKEQSCGRF